MKLDGKQKILLPIIVFAFIFIGWQLYDMIGGSSDKTIVPTDNGMGKIDGGDASLAVPIASQANQMTSMPALSESSTSASIANQNQIENLKFLKPQQGKVKYIEESSNSSEDVLMREYQELKKEEMLLNEKLAIAQARQKIAELNSKIASCERLP